MGAVSEKTEGGDQPLQRGGSFSDSRSGEDFGGCRRRPTPQLSKTPQQGAGFQVPREGDGGASPGSWWSGAWAETTPAASSVFFPILGTSAERQEPKIALLSISTASWECGLALPSDLWQQASLCPHRQSPEGRSSPQHPGRYLHSHEGCLAVEGRVCATSLPGPS